MFGIVGQKDIFQTIRIILLQIGEEEIEIFIERRLGRHAVPDRIFITGIKIFPIFNQPEPPDLLQEFLPGQEQVCIFIFIQDICCIMNILRPDHCVFRKK